MKGAAPRRIALGLLTALLPFALAGCSTGAPHAGGTAGGSVRVVAAENVWGSVVSAIGGDRIALTSIIANPNADPHEYEPTVADARAVADADLLVVNGAGYDTWAARLADASPDASRTLIDVGRMSGVPQGGNPHLWYSPDVVARVAVAVEAALAKADPAGAAYYADRRRTFFQVTLAPYSRLVSGIRARYQGVRIAASESIVEPLAAALELKVVTPAAFMDAVSEGVEPAVAAKTAAERQIATGEATLLVYNAQNVVPDVASLRQAALARHVPIVAVTETIPAGDSFASWQISQLEALESALKEATGR